MKGRNMKRLMALLASAATVFTLTLVGAPAHATIYITGCLQNGQTATERLNVFDGDTMSLDGGINGEVQAKFHLTASTRYYFCYDNDPSKPNRLFPDQVKFCASKMNSYDPTPAHPLRAFYFNPYYFTFDGTNSVDPGSYVLKWDGYGSTGDKVCTPWQGISAAAQEWLNEANRPAWTVTGHADVGYMFDPDITFHDVTTGDMARRFRPSTDDIIAS